MLYLKYEIVYYTSRAGRSPVLDYVNSLNKDEQTEIHESISILLKYEGKLFPPYAKHISHKIWELRVRFMNRHHRIFYFIAPSRKIVLLSAFLKKTQKTPRSEIQKAHQYYLNYLSQIL